MAILYSCKGFLKSTGCVQGAVMVTLKKGEDLPAADPNGYSDPYVKFNLNGDSKKSTVKRFTLNPAWNEKFEWFKVTHRNNVLILHRLYCLSVPCWSSCLLPTMLLNTELMECTTYMHSNAVCCILVMLLQSLQNWGLPHNCRDMMPAGACW